MFADLNQLKRKATKIADDDNVAVALADLRSGDSLVLDGQACALVTDVPIKHKVALRDFLPGNRIVMYGVVVGEAIVPIRLGEVLTTRAITGW